MGRPRIHPVDDPHAAGRASRAARNVRTVQLPETTWSRLDRLARAGETRPDVVERLSRAEEERRA